MMSRTLRSAHLLPLLTAASIPPAVVYLLAPEMKTLDVFAFSVFALSWYRMACTLLDRCEATKLRDQLLADHAYNLARIVNRKAATDLWTLVQHLFVAVDALDQDRNRRAEDLEAAAYYLQDAEAATDLAHQLALLRATARRLDSTSDLARTSSKPAV